MNKRILYKEIQAATRSSDQLVFVYKKSDTEKIVRYVTPLDIVVDARLDDEDSEEQAKVHCLQHLPEQGFRYFFLNKIESFHRVISRDAGLATFLEDAYKDGKTPDTSEID